MTRYKNIFIIFPISLFAFLNISNQIDEKEIQTNTFKTTSITISVVGDLMCHSPQYEYAKVAADSFDFTPTFNEISKYFDSSDFVFGNLETVTAGKEKNYSGYPFFNSPDDYITSLKKAGFNFLFTSNNHCLDRGEIGVLRTLENLKNNEINSTGTFSSQKERDSITIISAKGIRFAVVSYTYGMNGNYLPKGKSYLVNRISDSLVVRDIQKAKSHDIDFVLVYFHFGEEYQHEPNNYQKNVVQTARDAGADIILASHPHVLQPVEFFKPAPLYAGSNEKLDLGFVAYSLGNFISNQRWRYSDAGVILQFQITKDILSHYLHLEKVTYTPTWVYKGKIADKKQFVILPSSKSKNEYPFLSNQDYLKMNQSFKDSKRILLKYSSSLYLNEY
jgi:poly-gamma-glutamate synthesis protein (capsule biosynthesis protein)